jgi:hypothetical protein
MLILVGAFCLLNSCNNFSPPSNTDECIDPPLEETEIPDGEDASSDDAPLDDAGEDIQSPSDENDFSSSMDVPLVMTESYQAYQEFIKAYTLPNNFVYYDHIKSFGAFKDFVCLSDARYGDYSHYMYTLIDDNDFEFSLYVASGRESPWQPNIITYANENNMRVLSSKESGIYERDGLCYSYVDGALLSISWQSNELTYTLVGYSMLNNYPVKSTSLVGKMMNVQDAIEVLGSKFDLEKQ